MSYAFNNVRYNGDTMREIDECYNALCDDLSLIPKEPEHKVHKWVFVDSLSHVNEFIIRHVLKLQGKQRKVGEMEARDWGPFKSYAYILLVAKLEQTNKNILCSCHEIKLVEGDKDNIMKEKVIGYEPFFQGKVGDTIGAFFTDVWRMEVEPGPGGTSRTILQTTRHPKCDHLKNSIGLPDTLDISKGYSVLAPYLEGKTV